MTRLSAPGGKPHLLAPTTTMKLARRMLEASRLSATKLPAGFYDSPALDILLTLFVAEDEASYLSTSDLQLLQDKPQSTINRWLLLLSNSGFLDRKSEVLALTEKGYATVSNLVSSMFDLQRSLD